MCCVIICNTGTLSLREKRSGYVGVHVSDDYAHQVPAFFKCLLMHMITQRNSVSLRKTLLHMQDYIVLVNA